MQCGSTSSWTRNRDGEPTLSLYDWYVYPRNGRIEELWPITARGAPFIDACLALVEAGA